MQDAAQQGVAFPVVGEGRSTTATGRGVFADAARATSPELAAEIAGEPAWRKRYVRHARRLLEAQLVSADATLAGQSAALESLHERFEFVRDGGTARLADAVASPTGRPFETVTVRGRGEAGETDLTVPYRGAQLRGDALHRLLDRWVEQGIVEPSFADAIRLVMANPDWLDLSDQRFAVVGAGAEMGPLPSLFRWGAHVLPVDLPRPEVWGRILAFAREGRGAASIPVRAGARVEDDESLTEAAGADLSTDLPEIAAWLEAAEGPLTLGNYGYADGADHVRVSVAADALATHLQRRTDDLSLAMLATPTDVFAVPEDTVEAARRRFSDRDGVLGAAARAVTRGRLFAPNYPELLTADDGMCFGIADCLVPQQGPNYALAKALQRWRAGVARGQGHTVSINVAPPTRTRSVMRNRALAAAYGGAGRFGVEVFEPATSNTLMAALLVHDLRNPQSAAHAQTPLAHPLELLTRGANHGGIWRNPFAPRSVLGIAVLLGLARRRA